jgi:hypothetical protein
VRIRVLVTMLLLLCAVTTSARAQMINASDAPASGVSLSATTTVPAGWVGANYPFEITLSRALNADEGRVAVLVGALDVSELVVINGTTLRYAGRVPLPAGESQVVVYAVSPANAWQEIGRFALRVLTPRGYEQAQATTVVDIGWKSQVFEGHEPLTNAPPRARFSDVTLNAGIDGRFVRNGVTWTNAVTLLGSSFQQEALRFGERGDEAPHIDLSSYQVRLERNRVATSMGHVTLGSMRHLLNSFASRGATFTAPAGSRGSLTLAAVNGSNVVGWNNPLGFTRDDHRLLTGTLGVELLPRAGALRAETTFVTGSLLPLTGFNQQAITDAQDSRGIALRITGADAQQRWSVDGGLTRSRFVNPLDPLLAQGTTLVPVRDETRNARYLDVTFGVLRGKQISKTATASLTLVARHEQVDPFFKSIGAAAVQPDVRQNQLEAQAVLGQATIQAVHARYEDNLDDLASALKTLTRRNTVNAMLPLGGFASPTGAAYFPRITYTADYVHQFGDELPTNSDFNASHVPDQRSANQTLAIEWALAKWRAAYRLGKSNQDNRQPGRERADLDNMTHMVAFGVSPLPTLDVSTELGIERADNLEVTSRAQTRRFGANADWRISSRIAIQSLFSTTWNEDSTDARGRATQLDVQASWQVRLARQPRQKPAMRTFVKFSHLSGYNENARFGIARSTREGWSVNTGATVSLF